MLEAVGPAIDFHPRRSPVTLRRRTLNTAFAEISGKYASGDVWIECQVRLVLERDVQQLPIPAVVSTAGELDETATVVSHSIAEFEFDVTEVTTPFIPRPVTRSAVLVNWLECGCFDTHGRNGQEGAAGEHGAVLARVLHAARQA